MRYEYDAILHENPDNGGAYVTFPWDLKKEFGKSRIIQNPNFKIHGKNCVKGGFDMT